MIIAVLLAQLDFPMMKSKKSKRIESVELSQGNENRKMAQ